MEITKKRGVFIQITAVALTGLAMWFAKMPCVGWLHEPQMPEQLRKEVQ